LNVESQLVLGRGDADVVIDDPEISRRHALIRSNGEFFEVEDLDSLNGTWVNGQRIANTRVAPGDTIQLGKTVIAVEPDAPTPAPPAPTPAPPPPPPEASFDTPPPRTDYAADAAATPLPAPPEPAPAEPPEPAPAEPPEPPVVAAIEPVTPPPAAPSEAPV